MNKILKKITAVFTSAVLLTSGLAMGTTAAFAAEDEDTYAVAGSNVDLFGSAWNDGIELPQNQMTKNADGTYTQTYTADAAISTTISLKVVKNGAVWIGDKGGGNVDFTLTDAGTFTVKWNPDANYNDGDGYVTVEGANVKLLSFSYETIRVTGNGSDNWMNGVDWNVASDATIMEEVEPGIFEITFNDVAESFTNEFKFHTDTDWTFNWGAPDWEDGDSLDNHIGEWLDAKWNSSNLFFGTEGLSDVTISLDLTEFDPVTHTGAKFKVDAYSRYLVAGRPAEGIFGTDFDPTNHDNDMYSDDGAVYEMEYTVDKAYSKVLLKVVESESIWHGDANGDNVEFELTGPGTFTVYYDTETETITVEGDIVKFNTEFTYHTVTAAGNGEGAWLNGANWDPASPANVMNEIAPDVWQISYKNVPYGDARQIKFCLDGDWTAVGNFGKLKDGKAEPFESGVWFDAQWDGDNIAFDLDYLANVTATIDLSNFDYATKQGAKYKIDIAYIGDVDGDADITIDDATELQRYLSEFIDETDLDLDVADVNGDGKVNIKDVTEIQRFVADIIDDFVI